MLDYSHVVKDLPHFKVDSDAIHILESPSDFRRVLSNRIKFAKRRILIASLYIGAAETDLIEELRSALLCNEQLQVTLLIDYARGSRVDQSGKSSLGQLSALAEEFKERISINTFRSTRTFTWWFKYIPQRFNEVLGVQHIKAYVFDDECLISGANLSCDYFRNRQDRYVLFEKSKEMADYFHELILLISSTLQKLEGSNQSTAAHLFNERLHAFNDHWALKTKQNFGALTKGSTETLLCPTIQFGDANICMDDKAMRRIFDILKAESGHDFFIASPYLNPPVHIRNAILESRSDVNLVCSSPEANGFFGSKGISRFVPVVYSYFESLLFLDFKSRNKWSNLLVHEYYRKNWTWHAKGVWLQDPTKSYYLAVLGSSNLNHRSLNRDLEAQIYILTNDATVKKKLDLNLKQLLANTKPINYELLKARRVPLFVKIASRIFRTMF